ncbi:hypothetical protein KIN20_025641 [Parelaphostrongylus tenuis]|uniref:Uncharacterized protein n=1 Tax=Parelaphostrongylus tenuis TaxID=148309 RepID=A0AAD5QXT4_PARTN|nr:hypothetical protein KIN20_025641 [Parelaphostrongylus tenuis]
MSSSSVLTAEISKMLDPLTVACVLAVLAGIVAIMFYLFSGNDDEREFEKVYGENARKLFSHEREKPKSKVRLGRKKEVKEKKNEQKLDADFETEVVVPSEQSVDFADSVAPTSTAPPVKASMVESSDRKPARKEKVSVVEHVGEENLERDHSIEDELALRSENLDENKENQSEHPYSEARKKKRNKGKKEEDDAIGELLSSEKELMVESTPPSNYKSEKEKKSKKKMNVVNINELDSNKVLTRLASLEEIEPEYISYLASYFHDTHAKIYHLEEAVNCLEKREVEMKKKIDQHQQSRAIADKQIADHVRAISELTSKVQSLSVAEAASKQQIVHLNNVRVENETLKSALSKSAGEAAAAAKALANFEAVKASNAELSGRLAKVTRSLNESMEQNAALKQEISDYSKQTAALENLKLEFTTLDSVARKLKTELEEKTRAIEESKKMESDSEASFKKVESERDEVIQQFAQARIEWEKKEKALMNEYTSLKNLVDELNKEVAKIEQFKKEQDELEQKLIAKEAELVEKSARLAAAETEKQVLVVKGNDRSAELQAENVALRKKLSDLENELSEEKSSRKLMVNNVESEQSAEGDELITEVVNPHCCLVYVFYRKLNVWISASLITFWGLVMMWQVFERKTLGYNRKMRSFDNETSKYWITSLDWRSNWLRHCQRNYLLDRSLTRSNVTPLTPQLRGERELVASTIGSIVNSPLDGSNYNDYINDLAKLLKAALRDSRKCDNDGDKKSVARLQGELGRYRDTLNSLAVLLTQIELGVHERESFYKDKVAQLESELDKA